MLKALKLSTFIALAVTPAVLAHAVTVPATSNIYAAGGNSPVLDGTAPIAISVLPGGTITFSSITVGASGISLDGGASFVNADGDGLGERTATSSNTGAGSISGIKAPFDGYLVGVFVGPGGPSGAAPAALDFSSTGMGDTFATLSPLLDQTFFIGDGVIGDFFGNQAASIPEVLQQFIVPAGATTLYLGISDAGGFNGAPGEYGDNLGSFSVTSAEVGGTAIGATVPEPSSFMLLGTGFSAVMSGLALRRKYRG